MGNHYRIYWYFFIFISFLISFESHAQDVCSEQLGMAEDRFEQGKLYEIEGILSNCLEDGFTRDEKIRAYRLLTLTYLYLNYHDKADETYLKLLRLSPEYEYNEDVDEAELINHHKKFTTKPYVYISAKAGLNFNRPIILHSNSLSDSENDTKHYRPLASYQVGGGADILLRNHWYVSGEFYLSRKVFRITDTHLYENSLSTKIDVAQLEFDMPVMLKYVYWDKVISPFFYFGISPHILMDAVANTESGTLIDNAGTPQPTRALPSINISSSRKNFNYSLLGGVGFDLKAGINYISVEVRYSVSMLNVIKAQDNYRDDLSGLRDLKYTPSSTHVDDDYKNATFAFILGFTRPLYKARKLEQ